MNNTCNYNKHKENCALGENFKFELGKKFITENKDVKIKNYIIDKIEKIVKK